MPCPLHSIAASTAAPAAIFITSSPAPSTSSEWYLRKARAAFSAKRASAAGPVARTFADTCSQTLSAVKVELKPDQADQWGRLEGQLGKDLADAHEGLRFNVELAEKDELPRFELKAKRLQDLRPQY